MRKPHFPCQRAGSARIEGGAGRKGDQKQCCCGQSGEQDRQAAGQYVILAHLMCLVCWASSRYFLLTTKWGRAAEMNTVQTE